MELSEEQIESLRKFALGFVDDIADGIGNWDGFQIQDHAVKHKILIPQTKYEPCGEGCNCAEYYGSDEWKDGITCYVIPEWLTRDGELPMEQTYGDEYWTCKECNAINSDNFKECDCGNPVTP